MTGLILKDLIQMKRILKTLVGLMILYIAIAVVQDSSEILVSLSVVICVITGINTLALDEQSKWNQYALVLPFSRASLVLGKYIMLFIMAVISAAVVMAVEGCIIGGASLTAVAEVGLLSLLGSMFAMSLVMPFIYKFGIERGRYVLMAIVMIPFLVALIGKESGIPLPVSFIDNVFKTIEHNPWILVVLAILFVLCSLLISVQICKKKEY